jgi:biopolymer transport protein ExbD
MRRRPRRRREEERVLPLVNVVFLLLVFFMLAGRLTTADPFEIEPPVSESEARPAEGPGRIALGRDGRLALDGVEMEREALVAAVAERLAEAPESELQIKAHGEGEAARLVELLAALRAEGVEAARLTTALAAR